MLILESEAPNSAAAWVLIFLPLLYNLKRKSSAIQFLSLCFTFLYHLGAGVQNCNSLAYVPQGLNLLGTRTLQLQVSPDVIHVCVAKYTSVCRTQVFNQLLAFEEREQHLLMGSIMLFNQGGQLQLSSHFCPHLPVQFKCFIQKTAISLTILKMFFTVFLINQSYIKP